MSTNKQAVLRFNMIDRCLRNTGRLWSFQDLKETIEKKLLEIDPGSSGISVKTLRNDLAFMRSSEGYDAPIETFVKDRCHYYKYSDPTFSINKKPLSESEVQKFRNAISVLQRFEGSPEFDWIEDIALMLKDHFNFQDDKRKIIGHDNDMNFSYAGYHLITPIFNAISNRRVIKVQYESFKGEKFSFEFHPYYLKQYNKRWFVFGLHVEENNPHWNIPLDRISSIGELKTKYIEDETDWDYFFSDIVGVTRPDGKVVTEVCLRFCQDRAPFVLTKPLHGSQKQPIYNLDGTVDIVISVIPNKELVSLILSFGDSVEVISPAILRREITSVVIGLQETYKVN